VVSEEPEDIEFRELPHLKTTGLTDGSGSLAKWCSKNHKPQTTNHRFARETDGMEKPA